MNKGKIDAIDWLSLESGTRLEHKTWGAVSVIKLDDNKAFYMGAESIIVDVKLYEGELGSYYYFQVGDNSWQPLTHRIWKV